jgi:methyl-accepting chemotaxis protein
MATTKADSARSKSADRGRKRAFWGSPRVAFLTFFAIGSFFIVLSGFIADRLVGPFFLGLLVPIGLMLVYWAVGSRAPAVRLKKESFADSIYYLGFLFTLVSLGSALFYLSGEEKTLSVVVSKFGLALATTILGLAIRVSEVSFSRSFGESKEAAQEKLSLAVDRFTNDLEMTCDKMEILLSSMAESVETAGALASQTTEESSEKISKTLAESVELIEDTIRESTGKISGQHEQLAQSTQEDLKKSISRIGQSIDQLAEQIEEHGQAIRLPGDLFANAIEAPLNNFVGVVSDASEKLSTGVKAIDEAASRTQELVQGYAEIASQVEEAVLALKELKTGTSELGQIGKDLNQIPLELSRIGSTIKSISDDVETAGNAIVLSSNAALTEREQSLETLQKLAKGIAAFETVMKHHAASIGALSNQLNDDANRGREALELLQENLVDSSKVIVEKLG